MVREHFLKPLSAPVGEVDELLQPGVKRARVVEVGGVAGGRSASGGRGLARDADRVALRAASVGGPGGGGAGEGALLLVGAFMRTVPPTLTKFAIDEGVINANLGGTIYGDAQRQLGTAAHSPSRTQGREVSHEVEVAKGSLLADILSEDLPSSGRMEVNSFHIQAVEHPASSLKVSARGSDDDLIEALESEDGRLIGVQFHPERLAGTPWDRLFDNLVARSCA